MSTPETKICYIATDFDGSGIWLDALLSILGEAHPDLTFFVYDVSIKESVVACKPAIDRNRWIEISEGLKGDLLRKTNERAKHSSP